MEKVSFYIPCFNAEKYIVPCIESILAQTYPLKEILVIDDGSTDNSVSLASKCERVKVIKKEKNQGLASARNTALSMASGDFIASCDSDVCLSPEWLENMMVNFSEVKVAGVGGKLLERNKEDLPDRWRAMHLVQHWGDTRIVNPRFVYGANTVFRKEVLLELGKYNELYRTNREDVDMCKRIKEGGYKIVYEPSAIAEHIRTDTLSGILNTFYGWKKHDYRQSNDFYDDFVKLWNKVRYSINTCYDMLSIDMNQNLMELVYPTVLIMFRFPLRDIKECKENKNELLIAFMALKNILDKQEYIEEPLKERIISHISDILSSEDMEKSLSLKRKLEKNDFISSIDSLYKDYNRNFIIKFYNYFDERLQHVSSLFDIDVEGRASETKMNLINRSVKDRIRNFIQKRSGGSKNFVLWENLRYMGEQYNLRVRHKSYDLLKIPSKKQMDFFWGEVKKSSEL